MAPLIYALWCNRRKKIIFRYDFHRSKSRSRLGSFFFQCNFTAMNPVSISLFPEIAYKSNFVALNERTKNEKGKLEESMIREREKKSVEKTINLMKIKCWWHVWRLAVSRLFRKQLILINSMKISISFFSVQAFARSFCSISSKIIVIRYFWHFLSKQQIILLFSFGFSLTLSFIRFYRFRWKLSVDDTVKHLLNTRKWIFRLVFVFHCLAFI